MDGYGYRFTEAQNAAVFICHRVKEGHPILFVSHDDQGGWQFLCGEAEGCAESTVRSQTPLWRD
jgi:hypothetical protein